MSDNTSIAEKVANRVPELGTKTKIAAGVGVAAAIAAGVAAIRKARQNHKGDAPCVYHLEPQGERWKLTAEGVDRAEAMFDTKDEGLTAARELAHSDAPAELVIHLADGSVQTTHRYSS